MGNTLQDLNTILGLSCNLTKNMLEYECAINKIMNEFDLYICILLFSDILFSKSHFFADISERFSVCSICMDIKKNPKNLHKCGHTFCTECIELAFQSKPACPICGMIYGKVTGDQPLGSISMGKSFIFKLEGFNDSNGSIVVTYIFEDGWQGVSFISSL